MNQIKQALPLIIVLLAGIFLFTALRPEKSKGDFDVVGFGKLPVLANGRVKPYDTLARNSLLMIHGKQTYREENGSSVSAIEWLLEVLFKPEQADVKKVFLINNPEVLGLFGWEQNKEKYFSFKQLEPFLQDIERQAKLAGAVESANRNAFQREIYKLYNRLLLYHRLKNSFRPEDSKKFNQEIALYQNSIAPGAEALRKKKSNQPYSKDDLDLITEFGQRYQYLSDMAYFLAVPPDPGTKKGEGSGWQSTGQALMNLLKTGTLPSSMGYLVALDEAYREQNENLFNKTVKEFYDSYSSAFPKDAKKSNYEHFFNHFEPFYQCMVLYVVIFIFAWISWLKWPEVFGQSAFLLLVMTFVVHTWGLGSRMYLQGRPPVTNLYSSAIFIGWAAVLLGIILERIYRNGVAMVTVSAKGFLTLLIAHHLSVEGDTLEMMRAVLDSNFWLATHVVVVTLGYASTFLAGKLAIIYFIRGHLTNSMDEKTSRNLGSMVYGIVCFATVFSFVGTVLGGIWADQSWGRFWGWDPKENGALLIVLWNAIILHARWAKFIDRRGLMAMAVFGNIVTSFSWFGVNMLGIGLHSYGFMDSAFTWLMAFDISQVLIIVLFYILPFRPVRTN